MSLPLPLQKGVTGDEKEDQGNSSSDSEGKDNFHIEQKGKEKEREWGGFTFEVRIVSTTNRLDASFSQFAVCLSSSFMDRNRSLSSFHKILTS